MAKDAGIAARKVSEVAQKVWVQALVWSFGRSGWVETRRKVGRGQKVLQGKLSWAPRLFTIGKIKERRLCMYVCLLDSIVGQYQRCRPCIKAISQIQINMDAHKHTVHTHKQEHFLS